VLVGLIVSATATNPPVPLRRSIPINSDHGQSKVLAELVALGILDIAPCSDRRQKTVRLMPLGAELVRLGRRIRARVPPPQ